MPAEPTEHLFEIVDATSEENYFTIGLFPCLEDALGALEGHGAPWRLCEATSYDADSATIEIRKRRAGVLAPLDIGDVVWKRRWTNQYCEASDENSWVVSDCAD